MHRVPRLVMNGIFAVEKPSGISSAACLNKLQNVFRDSKIFASDLAEMKATRLDNYNKAGGKGSRRKLNNIKVKMGHGGTLDPLASGVLVVGVGSGTKRLQNYLVGGVKVYETRALLGASTTTGDSEGEILTRTRFDHITKELVDETREKFVGDITQTPPLFSALKMDGMPLYEYARKGLPLPKKIKSREVKVYDMKICDDTLTRDHEFVFKKPEIDEDGVSLDKKLSSNPTLNDDELFFSKQFIEKAEKEELNTKVEPPKLVDEQLASEYELESFRAPVLHFISKVSSGTYIRSLISDFGKALSSSLYMVELIRLEQAEWDLNKNVFKMQDFEKDERVWGPVLKNVLDKGPDFVIKDEILKEEAKFESVIEDETTGKIQDNGISASKRSIDEVEKSEESTEPSTSKPKTN